MDTFLSGVGFGVIAVLTLDTVGSILSVRRGFPYKKLTFISFHIWVAAAMLASRGAGSDLPKAIGVGLLAGFVVGLTDSTIGWWISWRLGAGRLMPGSVTAQTAIRIIFGVAIFASAGGGIGGLLEVVFRRLITQ